MELDPARLDDLGITAQDVIEALHARAPAGRRLDARRAVRAGEWTPAAISAA